MNKIALPWCSKFFDDNVFLCMTESIAIVGSSGKLLQQNYGKEIDACENVVRFNRALTDGFETFVGCRTTLRVLNNTVFNNNPIIEGWATGDDNFARNLRKTDILYIGTDPDPLFAWERNIHKSNTLWFFPYQYGPQLKAIMGLSKNPSVGFAMVSFCVCVDIVPKLYGFDTDPGVRTWYYGSRPNAPGPHHDVSEEQTILKQLAEEGKVVIR